MEVSARPADGRGVGVGREKDVESRLASSPLVVKPLYKGILYFSQECVVVAVVRVVVAAGGGAGGGVFRVVVAAGGGGGGGGGGAPPPGPVQTFPLGQQPLWELLTTQYSDDEQQPPPFQGDKLSENHPPKEY